LRFNSRCSSMMRAKVESLSNVIRTSGLQVVSSARF
jgi:hypothetical protein